MNEIKYIKIRDVKDPIRAHSNDAGIDFFMPELNSDLKKILYEKNSKSNIFIDEVKNSVWIYPNKDILIPSGIKMILPENTALIAFNKSGIATKYKLIVGASVIDEGYRGEIHIHLINTSNEMIEIISGQKLVQFILFPVIYANTQLISENEFNNYKTERGEGGFGSTGVI